MSAANKWNLTVKIETSLYKFVPADAVIFVLFLFLWKSGGYLRRKLNLPKPTSKIFMTAMCVCILLTTCYTLSVVFIGCLLAKFHIRMSKDSLFNSHKLSVILFYVLQKKDNVIKTHSFLSSATTQNFMAWKFVELVSHLTISHRPWQRNKKKIL